MNDSIKREQSELDYSAERENLRPKGKKIINPWRNHEGYNCFGCSPDNPIGATMRDITVSVAVLTIPSDFTWSSMRMVTIS